MSHWRNIGFSENEDTGKKVLIWQCQECGEIVESNLPPKDGCPKCERGEAE